MHILGYPLETIYLGGLIISGCITLLYVLLSDIVEAMFEFVADGILNPTLVLTFVTFTCLAGYIFERFTSVSSLFILVISLVIAFILVSVLNIFVLVPLSSAEATLAYSEEDLKGRVGKVIISIPQDGFGEVLVEGNTGSIAKPATGFDNESIAAETEVLVIDVQNGVLHVSKHEPF